MLTTPAIFYAPHQDDEALGMGGAIVEHVEAGRPVFVVLLTDGRPSGWMDDVLNGRTACGWHQINHDFGLSRHEIIQARNRELLASCDALGVHRVFLASGGGLPDSDATTLTPLIEQTITDFESQFPGSSHKLISGQREVTTNTPTQAHLASYNAAMNLYNAGSITDFRFYRVREYDQPVAARSADHVRTLTHNQRLRKARALNAYRVFDPPNGRFGFGNHSVHQLITNAIEDPREYIDFP